MFVFVLLAIAFLLMMALFCLLLYAGLQKDTLNYDLNHLWESRPDDVRLKIRKTFE
ncbi:hypothetical protein [Gordoniibacillus kamchatkensis]|uniref:hypothetical protein n=1 Tax=Gordoniibacillus kamchatkensis TaxID=1590651 RepID=UPI000B053C00|nr:hypothetical protein [Paenibacillus sp. VKM B-2647]